MTKRVLVGGTFDGIHLGHQKLLDIAFESGDEVTVGLVTDEMLEDWKPEVNKNFEERKAILEDMLSTKKNWSIVGISDPYSLAVDVDHDALVVSWETAERGEEINRRRKAAGKPPLELIAVDPVLAEDMLPISSTRIRTGIIDPYGKRMIPVRIHTYSEELQEISVIDDVMVRLLGDIELTTERASEIEGTSVLERAKVKASPPDDYDYGVGIESGTLHSDHGNFMVECAVVEDLKGRSSTGFGPGFLLPNEWPDNIKEGITLLDTIKVHFNDDVTQVELFTERKVGKRDCMRSALLTAMIPRMSGELYKT